MICPTCNTNGEKSTLTVGLSTITAVLPSSYYDENGIYHLHDSNTRTTSLSCSNGHSITLVQTRGCPSCPHLKDISTVTVS